MAAFLVAVTVLTGVAIVIGAVAFAVLLIAVDVVYSAIRGRRRWR